MPNYYTRACNFYFGQKSRDKVKKLSIPLNGNNSISFDSLEIISRKKIRKIKINEIKKLKKEFKKKLTQDLKNISKKKNKKT